MSDEGENDEAKPILPSQFMRRLRPELYSDTGDKAAYVLTAPLLEYQLESLTARNESHEFEVFCRKLCERTICPHLRPQSGPEGGGDSKADADSVHVADEITRLTYVGEANAGKESWGFAYSAKAQWTKKVRDDVKGLIDTGRKYDRIYFVTSRAARAKTRAKLEQELTGEYGVPVTILDRAWIVKEVIENDRKDLAFNYLGVGEQTTDPLRLGPDDYSRTRQLADIEKAIADPQAFDGMEGQRVTEALLAAKLSRNLERPRVETDGRFERAIRLADDDGTYRQQLEARYERIWTAYWWFDEIALVNKEYSDFETMALNAGHARNLEFLVNLLQLLFNSVTHHLLTREEAKLDERIATLTGALRPMAEDGNRPNNRLEARTSLATIQMNLARLDGDDAALSQVWSEYSAILDVADGMGEFDPKRLVKMVEVAGAIAGNDPAYNDLVEKVADFVAKRTGEAEAATVLLRRAQQLELSHKFDMIRLLGKAACRLTKREHNQQLIEAQQLLMIAYRSAKLLWAARAICIFVAAAIVIEGEEDSELPVSFVPTMKIWAWLSLELGLLPDYLVAMQLLKGALAGLPLDEASQARVKNDIDELDIALSSYLLNVSDQSLPKLQKLQGVLDAIGLYASRTALLYTLGYEDVLRADGSIPAGETGESIERHMSIVASQPVAEQMPRELLLNEGEEQSVVTTILGMKVEVVSGTSDVALMAAQIVLGSLEAFFATAIDRQIVPHTEHFVIRIIEAEESEPSFTVNEMAMIAELRWPATLSPMDFPSQDNLHRFLMEMTGKVLAVAFIMKDAEKFIRSLYVDEAVQGRMAMVVAACTSYHRLITRNVSRLTDWPEQTEQGYPPRSPRPTLKRISFPSSDDDKEEGDGPRYDEKGMPLPESHDQLGVRSVIDLHAWDRAGWKGAGYLQYDPEYPPAIALLFENREAAVHIFQRWRDRFGVVDEREDIHVAIIRNIWPDRPTHYAVQVTARPPEVGELGQGAQFVTATRTLVMEPASNTNLEFFLSEYRRIGAYYLMPAIVGAGEPDFITNLSLIKRRLTVKAASEVGENDIESVGLRVVLARDDEDSP